jgi:hypothetical protein
MATANAPSMRNLVKGVRYMIAGRLPRALEHGHLVFVDATLRRAPAVVQRYDQCCEEAVSHRAGAGMRSSAS